MVFISGYLGVDCLFSGTRSNVSTLFFDFGRRSSGRRVACEPPMDCSRHGCLYRRKAARKL
jgi:hypothetical protein